MKIRIEYNIFIYNLTVIVSMNQHSLNAGSSVPDLTKFFKIVGFPIEGNLLTRHNITSCSKEKSHSAICIDGKMPVIFNRK